MKLIGISWLELPLVVVGSAIYLKRIHCLWKDLKDGQKYAVRYTITAKLYFPLTNQYFVSLDDPDYLHHEVDAAVYQDVQEGDMFPVYNARYSRYAFNKNGSYTLI